ncbi:MAG: hypothetical protein QOJ75_1232 [Chloroflexota bacterium]|jgi:hypothetical protein|nr:hypothetical protein [Chloroflexota bacterium]
MADPTAPPSSETTGRAAPGERRLAHPPSDRYRDGQDGTSSRQEPAKPGSTGRAVGFASAAGLLGSAVITVLGGVFAISAGLVVVAVATGWAVAVGLRAGAGGQLGETRRVRLALALALAAVALGQAGLWIYGRSEGGVLAPLEYLWEVFGLLVPLQLVAGGVAAWLAAR